MFDLKHLLLVLVLVQTLSSTKADEDDDVPEGAQLAYAVPHNGLGLMPIDINAVLHPNSKYPASLAGALSARRSIPPRAVPVDPEETSLETICKSNDNEFICLDCKTLIMCVDRIPYKIPCKTGNVCYNDKDQFKGGVCYPNAPVECTCSNDDIFKQDYYDSSKFLSCEKKGAEPEVHKCSKGEEFNEELKKCGTPVDTSCKEVGTFSVKSDCRHYHTCIYTTSGWFQRNFTCDGNTMYNEETGRCEDPCGWNDGTFKCSEEGRFPNQRDCTSFFECIVDPSDSNNFLQTEYVCPEGYEWLPFINRHHCVAKESTIGRCDVLKPSVCEIPDEWCQVTPAPPPPPSPETVCKNAKGTMIGEQCFGFSNVKGSCDAAKEACGGSLASITDTEAVADHLYKTYGGSETFWIGATPNLRETLDGINTAMHLFMMPLENGPQFAYQKCNDPRGFVCEIDLSSSASQRLTPEEIAALLNSQTALPTPHTIRTTSCPDDTFQVGQQCFFIPTEGFQTWYGAQEVCQEHDGFLAEPESIPEFHDALSKQTSDYGFWLGGSTGKQGGGWYWSERGAMVGNSASFVPGSPNQQDKSEKCLFLMRGMMKPLAARSCSVEHHYFVCEKY